MNKSHYIAIAVGLAAGFFAAGSSGTAGIFTLPLAGATFLKVWNAGYSSGGGNITG